MGRYRRQLRVVGEDVGGVVDREEGVVIAEKVGNVRRCGCVWDKDGALCIGICQSQMVCLGVMASQVVGGEPSFDVPSTIGTLMNCPFSNRR